MRGDDASLADARRAQAKLGPEIWSQVIRIENDARSNRYPRVLHALVFELADILWFYTDSDGTQSLSLHRGRLAEEKSDLAPLLHAIEPGFARWSLVSDDTPVPSPARGELPNGCLIESVAALRSRLEHGKITQNARLLSYYIDTAEGRFGHTVLTYATERSLEVIDPERPGHAERFPISLGGDALQLARAVDSDRVAAAHWVPVSLVPAARSAVGPGSGATLAAEPADLEAAAPSPAHPSRRPLIKSGV